MEITYKRQDWSGTYFARSDTHQFTIYQDGKSWHILVRELKTTADVTHAVGQPIIASTDIADTLRDAKQIVQEFVDFGPVSADNARYQLQTAYANVYSRQTAALRAEMGI